MCPGRTQALLGRLVGFEPTTSSTTILRYYQLSYSRRVKTSLTFAGASVSLRASHQADGIHVDHERRCRPAILFGERTQMVESIT
jgi:hypothetical protein